MSVLSFTFLTRSAHANVLVNLVCEFHNGHFQEVISLLFDQTYKTTLYELQVGIYYEGRAESKDRLPAGVLLPERNRCFKRLAGMFFKHPSYSPVYPQAVFTCFQH
jgi:hypothetical protein